MSKEYNYMSANDRAAIDREDQHNQEEKGRLRQQSLWQQQTEKREKAERLAERTSAWQSLPETDKDNYLTELTEKKPRERFIEDAIKALNVYLYRGSHARREFKIDFLGFKKTVTLGARPENAALAKTLVKYLESIQRNRVLPSMYELSSIIYSFQPPVLTNGSYSTVYKNLFAQCSSHTGLFKKGAVKKEVVLSINDQVAKDLIKIILEYLPDNSMHGYGDINTPPAQFLK